MAQIDLFLECGDSMSLETLLRQLFVTHTDGSKGIRVIVRDIAACADVTDLSCNDPLTLEQGIRERIGLDPCGKPALVLFNTEVAAP